MSRRGLFDAENPFNRGPLEPRELLKRKKELNAVDEHPEPVLGNVGDLSGRSGGSRHP
jgi:hypothetical protein